MEQNRNADFMQDYNISFNVLYSKIMVYPINGDCIVRKTCQVSSATKFTCFFVFFFNFIHPKIYIYHV